MNLNNFRDKAFATATAKGFHDKEYSNEHWLMLVITELSEAVEADRKGKRADKDAMIDTINAGGFSNGFFEDYIKDTVEDELADAVIRLLDLAGLREIDVEIDDDLVEFLYLNLPDETFTESVWNIANIPERYFEISKKVNTTMQGIFVLAKLFNIDLLWHIEQKIKYNEHREPLHGKAY